MKAALSQTLVAIFFGLCLAAKAQSFDAKKQAEAMHESWKEVAEGEMPTWFYLVIHPEARLSSAARSLLQAWSASAGRPEEQERNDD